MQRSAQEEAICFDRPPYVYAPTTPMNKAQLEVMARGVRYRVIYDRTSLEHPGATERIHAYVEGGEEARVFAACR